MQKFGKQQSIKRVEDLRLLTGHGRFIDDIAPEGALHLFVLRSPVAHGTLRPLDLSAAREAPGVAMVAAAADLAGAGVTQAMPASILTQKDGRKAAVTRRTLLAEDRVRYVGDPVAFVVAETMAQARDAAELIEIEIDELPVHLDLAEGGEALHDTAPGNVAYDYAFGDSGAVEAAIAGAARTVTAEIPDNRIIVNSMEPRGAYAEIEEGGRLHVAVNGQGVWGTRDNIAKMFGLEKDAVRVTNPDVGGGFGMKASPYPEQFMVAHAARVLNRPVHWMSDRTEAMLSDNGGRDLTSTATLAFDEQNRILAYKVQNVCNLGAYNSGYGQFIQSELFTKVMPGTYDIPCASLECRGIYTNTTPTDAYRGAGRPEAIFVLERAMDHAARALGVDPWELRRINFIRPDQFPYTSATGMAYDVGEFERLLDRAIAEADVAGLAARKAQSAEKGLLRGMGFAYYIESILGQKDEFAEVVFGENEVEIRVGTQSNGQGHETVFATFLADQTGIPLEKIRVVQGDSALIPSGGGTGGSRSVTTQTNATLATVSVMTEAFAAFLAEREGVEAGEIAFDDERFRIPGSNATPTMLEVARMAREAGRTDLLSHRQKGNLDNMSFPNGCHVAEVELDPETGVVRVESYTVVDDFGNLINPMLAEGQVHGGVAQGLGQALMESVHYDEQGQLLTATFMDYAMPRSDNMPNIAFHTEAVPSVYNPMGMKGCGEAGTVGALAAITNAVADAVAERGLADRVTMPFTPVRMWSLLNDAA
ncbi:xanthine dehydrogenase family protein molybdopterin-binding subunit [Wenxinia saemankumensis]|uniref:Carbon-monoxide dehydrogenase large subunit n=1 Tax=Wenxinia saemankumensis TaxID=1447782 RepID=A0A1M6CRY4_9RHOB|nr:xanthine dehydrogenase family protein molybdopterin-binding subunit [Wenxinia saemankumensis]SHI63855.1 carbon-monoxide dehydrogenase large subunit [Wenxinia saemankumensis]